MYMRLSVFLGVADESYIKGQNGTKLCAAACTGLAGLESVKKMPLARECVWCLRRYPSISRLDLRAV